MVDCFITNTMQITKKCNHLLPDSHLKTFPTLYHFKKKEIKIFVINGSKFVLNGSHILDFSDI